MQILLTQEEFDALKKEGLEKRRDLLNDFLGELAAEVRIAPFEESFPSGERAIRISHLYRAIGNVKAKLKL